jgi:trimethylamine:corrinoid methyltransferase-like protein
MVDMRERSRRQARDILKSYFPKIISPTVDEQLREKFNILLPREIMRPGGY